MAIGARNLCDVGIITGRVPARACSPQAYRWILTSTVLASSMVFIDGSAVNLALPILQTDLRATNAQAQWVIEAYALFLSALMLVGGSLGDRLGRRRVFLWGIAGFAAASILCALAKSVDQLIAARAIQGAASALLTPGSLSIIGASIDANRRGSAIGAWSSLTTVASVAGPVIGGVIVAHASWRLIFLINVPLAAGAAVSALRFVPESKDANAGLREDWLGAWLATAGLAALVYALIAAGLAGWTSALLAYAGLGLFLLAVFVIAERYAAAPMMPLKLFASPVFSAVNVQTLLLYGALGGVTFLLPFDFILIQQYSPVAAGSAFLPFLILVAVLSPWAGAVCKRIGARTPLFAGSVLVALAFAGFALAGTGARYWPNFFVPVLLLGLGMSLIIAPLSTAVMDSAGSNYGVASGVNNAVSRTASLIAVAAFSLVVAATFNRELDARLPTSANLVAAINAERPKLAAARAPASAPQPLRYRIQQAIDESYVAGFDRAMLLAAALSVAGALCALALPRKSNGDARRSPSHGGGPSPLER
jgi:EmrB/QacA subfamily drug resistance transporter